MRRHEFAVDAEDEGERLDVVLVRRVEGMSRARARELASQGAVRVNGRRAKKSHVVAAGDRVALERLPESPRVSAVPDAAVPIEIALETEAFVIVNKPAGVPSHPLVPGETGTVANALLARYPEMQGVGYSQREPGILHRLDSDTSGLMIAARDQETFTTLREALQAGRIDKRYIALCAGRVRAPQTIAAAIVSQPGSRKRVRVVGEESDGGAPTEVISSKAVGLHSLIEVRATKAKRHQIRAHLAFISHPLVGDALYGGPTVEGLDRHFLHASAIELDDPVTKERVRVTSPLPSELAALVESLP